MKPVKIFIEAFAKNRGLMNNSLPSTMTSPTCVSARCARWRCGALAAIMKATLDVSVFADDVTMPSFSPPAPGFFAARLRRRLPPPRVLLQDVMEDGPSLTERLVERSRIGNKEGVMKAIAIGLLA